MPSWLSRHRQARDAFRLDKVTKQEPTNFNRLRMNEVNGEIKMCVNEYVDLYDSAN